MSGPVAVPVESESLEKSDRKKQLPPPKNLSGILTCISCLKPMDTCCLVTITLELLETEIIDAQRRKEPICCLFCQCLGVCLWMGWMLVVDRGAAVYPVSLGWV